MVAGSSGRVASIRCWWRSARTLEQLDEFPGFSVKVVLFRHSLRAGLAHLLQDRGFGLQDFGYGVNQGLDGAGGNEPAVDPYLDQLGVTGDVGGDHGTTQGQRLEKHGGQALGKAGQDQGTRGEELVEDPLVAQEAGDPYPFPQVVLLDQVLDLPTHRAIADDDQLEVDSAIAELCGRLNQDGLPLLLSDPANVHESRSSGNRGWSVLQEHRTDPDMDHMDPGPVMIVGPAIELAAGELADRDDEPSVPDLLAQAIPPGGVELLGTVHGEAVGWPSQQPAEHRHGRRVCPVVGVDMLDPQLVQPPEQQARLGKVDEVPQQTALINPPYSDSHPQGAGKSPRSTQSYLQDRLQEPRHARIEHSACLFPLGKVVLVNELSFERSKREPMR